jgi:hypothetical protein
MLDLTIRSICPPIPAFVLALAAALPAQAGGVMVIGDRPPGSAPSSGVVAATGGDEFAVALRADGSLFAWGDPIHGQTGVPAGTGFAEVATGSNHGIARRNDGTLVGWGRNQLGQRTVPSGTFTRIAAAEDHSLGIRSNGTLAAWGDPSDGMANVPSGAFIAIACGDDHNVALRSNGSLVAWGSSEFAIQSVPSGSNFVAVASTEHTAFALRGDGTIAAWGSNEFNLVSGRPSGSFVSIAAGEHHVVARRSNGQVVAWGRNTHGELAIPAGTVAQTIGAGDGFTLIVADDLPGQPTGPGFDSTIYWRKLDDGRNGVWRVRGVSLELVQMLPTVDQSSGWFFVGAGWFDHAPGDGDHTPEAVWFHGPSGTVGLWKLDDDCGYEIKIVGTVDPTAGWRIAAIANVDGDLDDDIVWFNDLTGMVMAWIMDGDDVGGTSVVGQVPPSTSWILETSADYDDDGTDDLFWRDRATGRTGWWRIAQGTLQTTMITPYLVPDDSGWRACGRGHFNDDYFPDLLWRNELTGANGVWMMNGAGLRSGVGYLPTIAPSTGWDIVDSGS